VNNLIRNATVGPDWVPTNSGGTSGLPLSYAVGDSFSGYFSAGNVVKIENFAPDLGYGGTLSSVSVLPASNLSWLSFSTASSGVNATYISILSRQCYRAQVFINNQLRKLEWDGDESNAEVVGKIADAIDLVGEPALVAAYRDLLSHTKHLFRAEKLLRAIAEAKDDTTETYRAHVLEQFCHAQDPQLRYSAVEALGNMASHSSVAKDLLETVRNGESNTQIAHLADLYIT
jgi:hypothetical protein